MASTNGKIVESKKQPNKRRVNKESNDKKQESDNESSSEESMELSGDESDLEENLEVQVEFEAQSPHEADFDGIKRLLKQLFAKCSVHLSDLADIIIAQKNVGSVVLEIGGEPEEGNKDESEQASGENTKTEDEDEDDIYGICTVINLKKHKGKEGIKQVKSLIMDKCKDNASEENKDLFEKVLNEDNSRTALLISERFINIPPQLALPLFKSLRSEIQEARKTDKKEWTFDNFVLISKSYKEDKKSQKKTKKKVAKVSSPKLTFANIEDEIILKESAAWFCYEASKDEDETAIGDKWDYEDVNLRSYRTVMILPFKS